MVICVKTTLNLDDRLLRRAKARAAEQGVTLTSLIEDALRTALEPKASAPYVFSMSVVEGQGFPFDVNDRGSIYDFDDPPIA
jgi:plasmid stability protein